jgi:hypothetical protein
MNRIQVPGWASKSKARYRREVQDEIMEALFSSDSHGLPHAESKWDE